MNEQFYSRAFWTLVTFLLGALVQYGIFGYATVRRSDFDRSIEELKAQNEKNVDAINTRLEAQDLSIRALELANKSLIGQLAAEKLVTNP